MPKKVLIIVDMQKDFISPKGALYLGHNTKTLVQNVVKLAKTGEWTNVFATHDLHFEGDPEMEMFGAHCMSGSKGQELIDELKDIKMTKLDKHTYTCGISNYLFNTIDKDTEIWVCGVCTHICVHDIVGDIYNSIKQCNGFIPKIFIRTDCVDDFDSQMANFAIERMKRLYRVTVLPDREATMKELNDKYPFSVGAC